MSVKIVFMGTPDFAVPPLKALIDSSAPDTWQLAGVVTQPDRPSGRGRTLTPPPVKVAAQQAGLPVLQPETLKTDAAFTQLAGLEPDLIVVAAFGQILRKNVLNLPPHGCLNIHASLLPRWRGASPVTAAIQASDSQTGVTLMLMDEGLDTGPIIAQRAIPIRPGHTGGALTAELAELGAKLLVETLPAWLSGQLEPQPQNDEQATKSRLLKKQDGLIDWSQTADEIERQVRAYTPWPGTFTYGPRGQIKILAVQPAAEIELPSRAGPGALFTGDNRAVYVATGKGALRLVKVQPAGKTTMSAEAMLNGQPELVGTELGDQQPHASRG